MASGSAKVWINLNVSVQVAVHQMIVSGNYKPGWNKHFFSVEHPWGDTVKLKTGQRLIVAKILRKAMLSILAEDEGITPTKPKFVFKHDFSECSVEYKRDKVGPVLWDS